MKFGQIFLPCLGIYLQGAVKALALVEICVEIGTIVIFGYNDFHGLPKYFRGDKSDPIVWLCICMWAYCYLYHLIAIFIACFLCKSASSRDAIGLRNCLLASILTYLALFVVLIILNLLASEHMIPLIGLDSVFAAYKIYSFWIIYNFIQDIDSNGRLDPVLTILSDAELDLFLNGGRSRSSRGSFLTTPYQKAFEIPISNLVINYITPLGKGNFGVVYKANFLAEEDLPGHMNERIVAVKTVPRFATSQHFMQLLRELQILNYIGNHDNIVNLIGACTTDVKQKKIFIVLEYCGLGSMLEYLRSNRAELTSECDTESLSRNSDNNAPLTGLCFRDLVKWAMETASGMKYIADKKVIHGDLAARNILLTFDRRVKIGDFGMSNQVFHCKHRWTKANVMIPWRWMAIEGILDKNFSLSCDIWSYGITVWEFFSGGEVPYVGMEYGPDYIQQLRSGELRLECPEYGNEEIYQELCKCWKLDPTERPGFAELKLFFKKIYSNLGQDRRHVSIRMYDSDIEEVDC
ncbi:fibroblast growth factor receptor 1 isoform X1 [Folsomia candida]|uniref:fibroblast growth factor receptor 1 isoform X1 n=1 Tax=Folsomia candida TaxID=158441 RepID=UPI000B8F6FE6|nr:fibroblast growth factor receptor 1 isoform X1 [Folsomia candida]